MLSSITHNDLFKKRYTFEDLVKTVNERLSKISLNKNKFNVTSKYYEKDQSGIINVHFDNIEVVSFYYLVTNIIIDSHYQVRGSFTLYALRFPRWYQEYLYNGIENTVTVNEFFEAHMNGGSRHNLSYFLDLFLPVDDGRKINDIKKIAEEHNIAVSSVYLDTFRKAYVLKLDINKFLCEGSPKIMNDVDKLSICKYVSLETYLCMLDFGTFRMNSMVAMNDLYEGIWLNSLIYSGEKAEDYYKAVVRHRNSLITSFTDKVDVADMWRFYGENGRGVCLCFNVDADKVIKVVYVNSDDKNIENLRSAIDQMKELGYNIIVEDGNSRRCVVKSSSFRSEVEYRLYMRQRMKRLNLPITMAFFHHIKILSMIAQLDYIKICLSS